jgi:hypothetical protein
MLSRKTVALSVYCSHSNTTDPVNDTLINTLYVAHDVVVETFITVTPSAKNARSGDGNSGRSAALKVTTYTPGTTVLRVWRSKEGPDNPTNCAPMQVVGPHDVLGLMIAKVPTPSQPGTETTYW